jgi:succinate-acetate transporter protein
MSLLAPSLPSLVMLQIIGGTGEWVLGNTFSPVLFFTYGKLTLVSVAKSKIASLDGCSKYRIPA